MTAPIACAGSPRKPAGGYGICSGPKIQGSGDNVGLNASKNASVLSAVGTMYGNRTLARMMFLNGNAWFITSAIPRPSASLKTVAKPV